MRSTSARSRTSAARARSGALALLPALLLGCGFAGAPAPASAQSSPPPPAPAAPQAAPGQPVAPAPAAAPLPPQAKPTAGKPTAAKPAAAQPAAARPAAPKPGSGGTAAGPASADLLAAVQAHYERVQDLRARFVQQSRVASLGREDSSSGSVTVRRPGRMRWEYSEPESHVLTLEGDTLRMYLPAERQLQIAALDPRNFSPTALTFLLGQGDLRTDFAAEPLAPNARGEVGLRLRPRADSGFEYLELWLAPGELALRESVVLDLFGNRTSVRFEDVVENAGVPETAFALDVPPGTEVIDLRPAPAGKPAPPEKAEKPEQP